MRLHAMEELGEDIQEIIYRETVKIHAQLHNKS